MNGCIYLLCIVLAIAVHELGHAILMVRYGVSLKEICLLGMGPKLMTFRLPSLFKDTPVTIRLFPIGAFVESEEDKVLPFHQDVHIASGGIAMNLLFTAGMILIVLLSLDNGGSRSLWVITIVCFAVGAALWRFSSVCDIVILSLGTTMLALIGWSLTAAPVTEAVGGPIAIISEAKHMKSVQEAVVGGALISLSLALINAVPLPPLDGGRILIAVLQKYFPIAWGRWSRIVKFTGVLIFSSLIVLAFVSDFVHYIL